jgi:hypothetical protein
VKKDMVSLLAILVFLICYSGIFLLLRFSYTRFGEPTSRVRILWLAPVVVLPIAIYFCLSAGASLVGWVLFACGGSLLLGAALESIHLRSARISIDVARNTIHIEKSIHPVLTVLMLLDAICYTTLLMLVLSVFPALHTAFFRQFTPELALFSLGSRSMHALLLFLFWRRAKTRYTQAAAGSRYVQK